MLHRQICFPNTEQLLQFPFTCNFFLHLTEKKQNRSFCPMFIHSTVHYIYFQPCILFSSLWKFSISYLLLTELALSMLKTCNFLPIISPPGKEILHLSRHRCESKVYWCLGNPSGSQTYKGRTQRVLSQTCLEKIR